MTAPTPIARNRETLHQTLRQQSPLVAPSLLACDFGNLEAEVRAIEAAGARLLHLDVMDGHFVPNLSFGLPVVQAIRRMTELPLDVHLMIDNPADYATRYRDAGADIITVHAEVLADPRPLLDEIKHSGAMAGLSLNPPTPIDTILPFVDYCDLVLVMSVMPGFGGQEFQDSSLAKLSTLRDCNTCDALLEVDGGVNQQTIGQCAAAGANLLVAGTAVFSANDYSDRLATLDDVARTAVAG